MNSSTTLHLIDDYLRDGVVGPIDVLTVEEATRMNDAFLQGIATSRNHHPITDPPSHHADEEIQPQQYHQNNDGWFKTHLFVPWVNQIVRHPNLIAAVQTVLQSKDIRCWSCDFNVRYGNQGTIIAPHQDATYAGLCPAKHVVTAWVALSDPVTINHGGLIFYPGSHMLGQIPHTIDINQEDDDDDIDGEDNKNGDKTGKQQKLRNVLSRGQRCTVPTLVTQNSVGESSSDPTTTPGTSIPLQAGQATLHHFYTVHASGQNLHNEPRIGLAIRYMTAAVRRHHYKVLETITWISGCTDIIHHDCFAWEPILPEFPTIDELNCGKVAHSLAMKREMTNYFSPASEK
jgi:ectoine hydroxylase-related dioxygenase (phytanoyl-CoA dioxygenase family)